ncbi:MAG TPA: TetR/AcrR family transcriptional regulator [Aquificaceae bacterium]|nr:TetR/AcrR family transcriptional regulator [Aquificaceae bacterium]
MPRGTHLERLKEEKKREIMRVACKLFAEKGYHNTTIPDIAKALNMSVGNLYNYFSSKEELAKEIMLYTSKLLGEKLRKVNELNTDFKEKSRRLVRSFIETALEEPELINYFLKVYLVNREVFKDGCEGFACVSEVVTEIMIFVSDGVEEGVFRNQDFFTAFVTIMGPLGGIVFLYNEGLLEKSLPEYIDELAENIWKALGV